MAKKVLKFKINADLLDRTRVYKGEKGNYFDFVMLIDEDNPHPEYGTIGFVTQDVSKEEREGGKKMPILGNVKKVGVDQQQQQPQQQHQQSINPPAGAAPASSNSGGLW